MENGSHNKIKLENYTLLKRRRDNCVRSQEFENNKPTLKADKDISKI